MHSGPVLVARGLRLSIAALATLALGGGAATALSAPETSHTAAGKIAFSVQHGDNDAPWDIYVVRTDSRWVVKKTTTRLDEDSPVWSPDGRHIAFEGWTIPGGADMRIYTMNQDGTHRRRLARGRQPRWSADGRRIAYDGSDGVYVMNVDGTGKTRLARGGDPRWSPGGKQIAFTHRSDVYVVSASGGHERRLTRTRDNYVSGWAPGRKIIFTHRPDDASPAIYIVNVDGSDPRKVIRSTNPYDNLEVGGWSRDGQLILYSDSRGVAAVRPSDGFVRRLARGGSAPTWGPGDREIAFTISAYSDQRHAGIWIANRDGTGARRVATAYESCYNPTWAPR
jgi:Tol biopolymer transport system component